MSWKRGLGSGFRVSGLGFRVSGFGFRIMDEMAMCFIIETHIQTFVTWGQMHVKVPMKSLCAKREG